MIKDMSLQSPSHPVGSKQAKHRQTLQMLKSPSHTVGLELYDEEEIWDYLEQLQSPSHAVGLEPL